MSYYLGIDIGTSGIRIIAINQLQQVVAQVQQTFSQAIKHKIANINISFVERNPEFWWWVIRQLFSKLSTKINLSQVVSIAVDGTSGTVIAVDQTGKPLHHALMYNDQRATIQSNKLNSICPVAHIKFSSSSALAKILWLWERLQQDKIFYFLNQADWITAKLSGQLGFSDVNNVLKMGYDIDNNRWPKWYKQLGIKIETLPKVLPVGKFIHLIHHDLCQYGFSSQVQIISGTTDSTAAVFSSGAIQVGDAVTSLGSTLVTKIISDRPFYDSTTGVYSQPFGKYWLVGGSSNCGGAVLRQHFSEKQIIYLAEQLDFSHPTGLNYYPLPAIGERFPIMDPYKKPLLEPRPDNDAIFFQAILEAITAIEKQAYNVLSSLGAPQVNKIYTLGAGAKNRLWTNYRKKQLAIPIFQSIQQEAAYGTAKLAQKGYKK
jgi:D-ribulokinase